MGQGNPSERAGAKVKVCFVCLGNICRSPTAEAVFRKLVAEAGLSSTIGIDSAGTGSWHVGASPDPRSTAEAKKHGVDLKGQARGFLPNDFDDFDYVVAMDKKNRKDLQAMARDDGDRAKIQLLRNFGEDSPQDDDVPDPYFGEGDGFRNVFEICKEGSAQLLQHILAADLKQG